MAETLYMFNMEEDFPNGKVATDRLTNEIKESDITIALDRIDTDSVNCNVWFKDVLPAYDSTTLTYIVSVHAGEPMPTSTQPVKIEEYKTGISQDVHLFNEFRDSGGKLRVHQTSRKDGLAIHWTSTGDDKSNTRNFGGGTSISHKHIVGDSTSKVIYIDFNVMFNESWIHEVILTWDKCDLDVITVDIVPNVCMITDSTAGNFNTYGPIVIPAMPGTGCCNIVSDVYAYNGGLVAKDSPSDPTITAGPAFWNADFNESTSRFENLTAAPLGDGAYNIFHEERALNRIFNRITLLQSGFQIFNSSDADELTHGLRLRATFDTNGVDHEWAASGILVMHRAIVNVQSDGCI